MRIAVSNPDNIGDFVVRQPMLAALAAAGHELLLIVRTHVAPLAALAFPGATIAQCVADPYQPDFQIEAAPDDRLLAAAKAFNPDLFVAAAYQHTQLEEQLCQRLPRAKAIGFAGELFQNDRSRNITHPSAINWAVQVQVGRDWLESRKNEVLAGAILGNVVTLPPPRLTPESRFVATAAERLRKEGFAKRKFWVVCAGEGSAYTALKNWPLEKWAEVCTAMVRDHALHLVFVGTQAEHESTAAIRARMGELAAKTIDMTANPDGLDTLIGVLSQASGYLGKDTGPMHLAAALGKPVVAVFGGGHWPRFLPGPETGKVLSMQVPCSDCNWTCPFKTSYCVKNIPVDNVLDALRAVLSGEQKEFEVDLLELQPWVVRAMVLDAAGTANAATGALETERFNFHQWHNDRLRDIEGLRQDLARVQAENDALAQARDTAAENAAARLELERAVAAIDAEKKSLQGLLNQREGDLIRLTERSAIWATQAEIARKQCEELTSTVARQSVEHAEIERRHTAGQARLESVHAELALLRTENNRLDRECSERAAALDAALASLDQVESRYQGTIADLRQQHRRSDDQLRSVLSLVPDLRDELARCLAEVARIPAIEQDQAAKQSLIDHLNRTLETVEADRAERLKLLNAVSAKLSEVEADQRAKQEVIDHLSASLAAAKATIQDQERLLARTEISLLDHQQRIGEIEADRAARLNLIERISADLAAIEADRAHRGQQIELLHAHIANQQAEIAQLEASLLPRRLVKLVKGA